MGFRSEPNLVLNSLLQGGDNLINENFALVRKCFPNDKFESIPWWDYIFFTVNSKNFNLGFLEIFGGSVEDSSRLVFQRSLGEEVGNKYRNPSIELYQ